jgi:integrase
MTTAPKRRTRVKRHTGIYLSVSGKYEIAYRDSDGRLRFETIDGTLEDAKGVRADRVAKLARGERVAPVKQTFAAYAETWFSTLTVRPRTVVIYRANYEKHLKPKLGQKRLAEITVDDVAALIAKMTRDGKKANTVQLALAPLSLIFRHAERAGLVASSPVRKLHASERPKADAGERRTLEPDELVRLLAKAGRTRALLAVGAFAGLRISEALGLTWADVDFAAGVIRVRKQLDRGSRARVDVKTARSRRDVVLVPELARVLREHKMKMRFKEPTDFVFSMPDGRARCHVSTMESIRGAATRAGLDGVSFHALRHGYASMLIGMGTDIETVSRMLGHSSSSITLSTYSHLLSENVAAVRDGLSERFGHLLAGSS